VKKRSLFSGKCTLVDVQAKVAQFEEKIKAAEAERKALQEQLATALAQNVETAPLQRRAAEVEAILAAAPEARRLFALEIERGKANDAAPHIQKALGKIGGIEGVLREAGEKVAGAWEDLLPALDGLKDLPLPRGLGMKIKVLLERDLGPRHLPSVGSVVHEYTAPREAAASAIAEVSSTVTNYLGTWRAVLESFLATLESDIEPAPVPKSQQELMQEHEKYLRGEKA
jgi:hypothetical protein